MTAVMVNIAIVILFAGLGTVMGWRRLSQNAAPFPGGPRRKLAACFLCRGVVVTLGNAGIFICTVVLKQPISHHFWLLLFVTIGFALFVMKIIQLVPPLCRLQDDYRRLAVSPRERATYIKAVGQV